MSIFFPQVTRWGDLRLFLYFLLYFMCVLEFCDIILTNFNHRQQDTCMTQSHFSQEIILTLLVQKLVFVTPQTVETGRTVLLSEK